MEMPVSTTRSLAQPKPQEVARVPHDSKSPRMPEAAAARMPETVAAAAPVQQTMGRDVPAEAPLSNMEKKLLTLGACESVPGFVSMGFCCKWTCEGKTIVGITAASNADLAKPILGPILKVLTWNSAAGCAASVPKGVCCKVTCGGIGGLLSGAIIGAAACLVSYTLYVAADAVYHKVCVKADVRQDEEGNLEIHNIDVDNLGPAAPREIRMVDAIIATQSSETGMPKE